MPYSERKAARTPSEGDIIKVYDSFDRTETAFYFEETGCERDDEEVLWRTYKLVDKRETEGGIDSMNLKKAATELVRERNAVQVFDEDDNLLMSVGSFFGGGD